jgi:hypothetical protein
MKVRENVLKVCLILPSVVKAGKPFSDYELICEIQVKNGLDLVKTIEILMVVKLLLHQLH